MRYLVLVSIVLGALLLGAGSKPRPNWDKLRWGMTMAEAAQAYPRANDYAARPNVHEPWLAVDQAAIARHTPLAGLIVPGSKVKMRFLPGAELIEFLVGGDFNPLVQKLKAVYGKPVSGVENDSACFDKDGHRIWSDPSGVGHVIDICYGEATFVDPRAGNAISLGMGGAPGSYGISDSFHPYMIVRIQPIWECLECVKR